MLISEESIREMRAAIEAAKSVRLDGSKETVRKAFMSYAMHAIDVLSRPSNKGEKQDAIRLAYIAPGHLVKRLETSETFDRLCSALVDELKKNNLCYESAASAVENFFKRSIFTPMHVTARSLIWMICLSHFGL